MSAPWVVSAAICSKVVVLLLLIHCFVYLSPCLCSLCDFGPCSVMQYLAPCLTCNHLAENERAGCSALNVVFLPCCHDFIL